MVFRLITSESLENLAQRLAGNLYVGTSSLFEMPRIVIQSPGMERWLSLKLADNLGISAGVEFYFLNGFFQDVLVAEYAPEGEFESGLLTPGHLKWLLFLVLGEVEDKRIFRELTRYMQGDIFRRLQLAEKLAELYDRYALYRADWLLEWEQYGAEGYAGEYRDGVWLAELWRLLKARTRMYSVAELAEQSLGWLSSSAEEESLPVHFFGISSMPPLYLQILTQVAQRLEVYFYYLEVSHEYWGLVRSEKELLRQAGSNYEEGNSLLATFGERNKDFLNLLTNFAAERGFWEEEKEPADSSAAASSAEVPLLQRVQAGIRFMVQPERKSVVAGGDGSILFHSCCGRMRQVQALQQQLLACFDQDATLKPKDVLVLTPVIRDFVPHIRAVFGSVKRDSSEYIPYTVSDRALVDDNRVCHALLTLLQLFRGRFRVSDVWKVYSDPVYTDCAGMESEELAYVRQWLGELQIHWGLNGSHKREISGVFDAECTWEEAEEALLLGYAAGSSAGVFTLHDGRNIRGVEVAGGLLGLQKWLLFLEKIFAAYRRFRRMATLLEWLAFCRRLLSEFYAESGLEVQDILLVLNEQEEVFRSAGVDSELISVEVFLAQLSGALEKTISGAGFIMGGVTFCQFQPMRNIPARIICMLGMDEGEFPRVVKPLAFDIACRERRLCDPSRKLDDLGVFLETLLSAEQRLLFFYSGRGLKKGEELAPAAPVEIFREYLSRYYLTAEGEEDVLKQLTIVHPLQSFSAKYFREEYPELVSYSEEDCGVARGMAASGRQVIPDFPALDTLVFTADSMLESVVELADLIRFYQNPCRWYLQNRCNVRFNSFEEELPADTERLELDSGYRRYAIQEQILQLRLAGVKREQIYKEIQAKRVLPAGLYAEKAFADLYAATEGIIGLLRDSSTAMSSELHGNIEFELNTSDGAIPLPVTLSYSLTAPVIYQGQQTHFQYYFSRNAGWNNIVTLWLEHLVYSVTSAVGEYADSRLYSGSGELEFAYELCPGEEAKNSLLRYLHGYYLGQLRPLPLFRNASVTYVQQLTASRVSKTQEQALLAAQGKYVGSSFGNSYPDSDDSYIAQCFGKDFTGSVQYRAEFIRCAERYVLPAFRNNQAADIAGRDG